MTKVEITDFKTATQAQKLQAAEVLFKSFGKNWPDAWPTIEDAIEEVNECLVDDRIALAATIADTAELIGWIGGISTYDGKVYELHPLVVSEKHRLKGVGRLLVEALERSAASLGALTIILGTDDVTNQTTLSEVNLYENTWKQINEIRNIKEHPFSFYQRLGFTIVGVVPDANGLGKPDIMMAKSLR
jgi:Acetyltransferase (GNAT) family.